MVIHSSDGDTLSTHEVANILNVNKSTVRKWSNIGILTAKRVGPRRDRLFKQEDIEKFLNQNKEANLHSG